MTYAGAVRGRADEAIVLRELLDRAAAFHGRSVELVGPPGVGKSTLLRWIAAEAADRGFDVRTVRAGEGETDFPFAGLLTLLRPLTEQIAELPDAVRFALQSVVGFEVGHQGGRRDIAMATLHLLDDLAAQRPQLLVFDDAQWLDPETTDVIAFISRRVEHARIALVTARRTVGLPVADSGIERLVVEGLDAASARSLLLGLGPISAHVAQSLWEQTGGNPLALTESYHLLDDQQRNGLAPLPEPLPVGGLVVEHFARQIAGLPSATRSMLLLAAVDPTGDLWPRLSAAGDAADLVPAAEARLVELERGGVTFRHPLVRTAVLLGSDEASRRHAHVQLAEVALAVGDLDAHALHRAAATTGPDPEVAELLAAVADRARSRGALASAALAGRRAAQLAGDRRRRAQLLLDVGRAYWMLGAADEAVHAFDAAAEVAADPEIRAEIAPFAGRARLWVTGHDDAVATLLAGITDRAGGDQTVVLMCEAVNVHLLSGRASEAVAMAEQAVAAATGRGPENEIPASIALALAHVVHGSGAADLEVLDSAEELVVGLCDAGFPGAAELAPAVAIASTIRDRFAPAQALLSGAVSSSRRTGMSGLEGFASALVADIGWRTGGWLQAWTTLQAVEQRAAEDQHVEVRLVASAYLTRLAAALDDVERCRELTAFVLAGAGSLGLDTYVSWADASLGLLHLGQGRWAEAVTHLTAVDERTRRGGLNEPGVLWWAADLIEALVRAGHTSAARRALAHFESNSARSVSTWAPLAVERCRALVDPVDALEHANASVDGFERAAMPFERARSLLVRSALAGADAEADRREASDLFAALGARAWARQAAGTGETTGPAPPLASLTQAERRVALSVAEGHSYREVADELCVSIKTVDFHLRNIFRKLELRNRSELTRLVVSSSEPPTR
jgi:DNA-binding CsgD family transcriptional regulator/tetratricopeptide (TPR) repeat protein